MPDSAKEKIIVAMDVADQAAADHVFASLEGIAAWCKIGMELFTREGPAVIAAAKARGLRVFLDLKFHDIPNTVASGVRSACALGVDLLTIHLSGGPEMIARAVEAAVGTPTRILGVSVLTSSDVTTLAAVGIDASPADQVDRLVKLGVAHGIPGIVCSPLEIERVRSLVGPNVAIVTPGVRPAGSDHGDQKRVLTPAEAIQLGADHLVIGRPIIAADDRRAAFEAIVAEIQGLTQSHTDAKG